VQDHFPEILSDKIPSLLSNEVRTFFESFQTLSRHYQARESLLCDDSFLILSSPAADFAWFRNEFYHYRNLEIENKNNLTDKTLYQKFFSVPNNPNLAKPIAVSHIESSKIQIENALIIIDSNVVILNEGNVHFHSDWFNYEKDLEFFDQNCSTPTLSMKGIWKVRSIINEQFHAAIQNGLKTIVVISVGSQNSRLPMNQIGQIYAEVCHVLAGQGVETVIFTDKKFFDLVIRVP
jgi:hypothetical protein